MDRDLQSIQEVRDLVARAKAAQRQLAEMSQQKLDAICKAVAEACAAWQKWRWRKPATASGRIRC